MQTSGERETADIETSSDGYAARFAGPTGRWMLDVQLQAVRSLLGHDRRQTILEVGGGHGQLAEPLAFEGYPYTVLGSDLSCRHRIEGWVQTGRVKFVTGDITALPFPDRSYDAVLCIRLLTHCGRWEDLVRELCRTARRTVIVEYPLNVGLHRLAPLFFGMKKSVEKNTRRWTAFRHRQVTAAFEACGFREESVIREYFWPLVLHRMLGSPSLSIRLETAASRIGLTKRVGSPAISKMIRTGA